MTTHLRLTRVRNGGFSLVELMVAMALSLVLLGGVLAIFASSRTTYETTDRLSRIQENGRFALDSMVQDIRSAGFLGCRQTAEFTNTLANPTSIMWNFGESIAGFDGEEGEISVEIDELAGDPEAGEDILVIRHPRNGAPAQRVTTNMAASTDDIVVEDATSISAQDLLLISDCNARAVFEVSEKAGNTLSHKVVAPAVGATTPGNTAEELGYAYTSAAEVVPVETSIYFLRRSNNCPPIAQDPECRSLFRRVSGSTTGSEELVEGVEHMHFAYGVRSGPVNNTTITYRRANDVTNWNDVVSVMIALLVRSPSEYGGQADDRDYSLLNDLGLGVDIEAPNDRRMRQIFSTTVTLRNATL